MSSQSWRTVGLVEPGLLPEARLQAHYAVQWLARTARAYIPAQPDDSHTNLGWRDATDGLTTHPIRSGAGLGLSVAALTLGAVNRRGDFVATLPLPGRTDREVRAWLGELAQTVGFNAAALDAPMPWQMPAHAIADGAAYAATAPAAARSELAAWFANADHALNRIRDAYVRRGLAVSPVRCWPHHFDIATLITLDGSDPEHARSVNVGLSPGDESYDEPYFYVSPWPYPDAARLLPLPEPGRWHTQGFLAAVLPASLFVAAPDVQGTAEAFLQNAVAAAVTALR